jgi:hypothetical protein
MKQSQRLADALDEAGIDHVMRVVVGAGHGFGAQGGAINSEAIAFVLHEFAMQTGDFNSDGQVDGADFLAWQRDPEIGELDAWNTGFGTSAALRATAVIPEPAAGWLAAVAASQLLCRMRLPR